MDKLRVLLACCVIGGLVAASVLPVARLPGDPGNYLGHFSAYGLAMVALVGVVKLRAWATGLGLVFLGIGIEFLQPTFGRENHWQDMLANAIGVGIGWLTIVVWDRTTVRE
jgi:VanZ family protein